LIDRISINFGNSVIEVVYPAYIQRIQEDKYRQFAASLPKDVLFLPLLFYFFEKPDMWIPIFATPYDKWTVRIYTKEALTDPQAELVYDAVILDSKTRDYYQSNTLSYSFYTTSEMIREIPNDSNNISVDIEYNSPLTSLYFIVESKNGNKMKSAKLTAGNVM
jgi:hypothetical protein